MPSIPSKTLVDCHSLKPAEIEKLQKRVKGIELQQLRDSQKLRKTHRDIFFSRHAETAIMLRQSGASFDTIRKYLRRFKGFQPSKRYIEALLRELFRKTP